MSADVVYTTYVLVGIIYAPLNELPFTIVRWRNALRGTRQLRAFMAKPESNALWAYSLPRPVSEDHVTYFRSDGPTAEPWEHLATEVINAPARDLSRWSLAALGCLGQFPGC